MPRDAVPDLHLIVTQEAASGSRRALKFVMVLPDQELGWDMTTLEPVIFDKEPEEHFQDLFRDLAKLAKNKGSEDWLAGRGAELFERLLPVELQRQLWSSRDSGLTVQITSNEAWIPWELLKLRNPEDESLGPFLAEAFNLTRWLETRIRIRPAMNLPMRRMALIVPRDSNLRGTVKEAADVKGFGGASRDVIEVRALYDDVKAALMSGQYDGWHFAGHGVAFGDSPHLWSILLEGDAELASAHLRGFAHRLRESRPLVFLNACHSGRGASSLKGMGGMAAAFVETGAGAFVGSYWAIGDGRALLFAKEFYGRFFAGAPIGEAVRFARLAVRERFGGNDWLAYTVFAHPLASCTPRPSERPEGKPIAKPREKKRKPLQNEAKLRHMPAVEVEASVSEARSELIPPIDGGRDFEPFVSAVQRARQQRQERIHEKTGMVLVPVPGGEFNIGAEDLEASARPVRRIRLRPFWIGKFPVTNEQYARFLEENEAVPKPAFWTDPRFNQPQHPVVGVSWYEAAVYCRWAGLQLPTEAQWEAAARGTDQRPYPWGKELPTPQRVNFGNKGTSPVGTYPFGEGPYGTQDQLGNVWEWCADPWAVNAHRQIENGALDPMAEGDEAARAVRGGSWVTPAQDLHAAAREMGSAKLRFNYQGFRCVWQPD